MMGIVVGVLAASLVNGSLLSETPVSARRARFINAPVELLLGAAGCTKDIECKGDRICVKGACEAPGAAVAPPTPVSQTPALSPPPLPAAMGGEADVIGLYRDGKVADARAAAERAGLTELANKLGALDAAYNAASTARDARRLGEAIAKFERVLVLDGEITPEANRYTRAAHRALSKLYADRATTESPPDARASLATALQHNSENETAARWLQSLNDAKARNQVAQWPPPDAPGAPADESSGSYRVRRGEQSRDVYAAQTARLLAQQENFRFQSLQNEKDLLMRQRPSVAGAVVGMVLNAALAITWVALSVTGILSPLLGGSLIAINVVGFITCAILAGVLGSKAERIDRRIAEINRQLGISFLPTASEWRALAVR